MTHPTTRVLVRALLVAALALPLFLAPLSAQDKDREREDEDAKTPSEDPLTKGLERRLAGKQSLDDVMIDIRWHFEEEFASARLFGDGAGVWNRSVGFRVPRARARAIIAQFVTAHFGGLPGSAGDEESRAITGRIVVSAGAVRKSVSQMADGAQSPVLAKLAESVLRLSKDAAASGGVRAATFEEGFAEQRSGKLAAGALDVRIFRKPSSGGSLSPGAWELRIYGAYVYDRELGGAGKTDSTRQLHLSAADFQALVGDLSAIPIATLPPNLYASIYTDLEINLLNQHKNIQARQFAGMTAQSQGERQVAFDRLEKVLETLHERVLKQGKKVEAASLVGPPREEEEEREREKEKGKDPDKD